MLWTHLVIHVHELALKGKNRNFFERQFLVNIRHALRGLPFERPEHDRGRVVVPITLGVSVDEDVLKERIWHLFGASHAVLAVGVPREIARISEIAVGLAERSNSASFRIKTERADKTFPITSIEMDRRIGEDVYERTGTAVSLKNPELMIGIEVLPKIAFVSARRFEGAGGLPVGTSGRFGVLLSGGIDSPVAAYEIMRRGGECAFVHFHSVPYTNRASIEKVREISGILAGYQGDGTAFFVPFADFQKEIVMNAPQELRVVLYRRGMMRIAERLLRAWGAQALVTGECLGQVASQTIENITAVEDAATLPVLRPLIARTKEEIIKRARDIGTYDISIRPHDDCCTLFMPSRPTTHASVAGVRRAEESLDMNALVERAAAAAEKVKF